jgi:hypothetical protein
MIRACVATGVLALLPAVSLHALSPLPADMHWDSAADLGREERILRQALGDQVERLQVLRGELEWTVQRLESFSPREDRQCRLQVVRKLREQFARARTALDQSAGQARWLARQLEQRPSYKTQRMHERVARPLTRLVEQDCGLIDAALAELRSAIERERAPAPIAELALGALDRLLAESTEIHDSFLETEQIERLLDELRKMQEDQGRRRDAGGRRFDRW